MVAYLIKIYFDAACDAAKRLISSWPVLLGLAALGLGFIFVLYISQQLAIFGGGSSIIATFVNSLYEAIAITYYLVWLGESSQFRKVRISELGNFDWGLFQSVISVMFIMYFVNWAVVMLTTGMDGRWLGYITHLLLVVLLNCLPETLYLKRRYGMDAIQESFSFTTRNWFEWYLPYLSIISPLMLIGGESLPLMLAQTNIFLPALTIVTVPAFLFPTVKIVMLPLGIVLAHWFMLFRANLYQELDMGSRRQRMFKARMN